MNQNFALLVPSFRSSNSRKAQVHEICEPILVLEEGEGANPVWGQNKHPRS